MSDTLKKMSLMGLVLMIFTSVFGFANSASAFYLMGHSATPWYIFAALFFFIPFALMMAEMGAAYRKEEGGIYSWMENSVALAEHLESLSVTKIGEPLAYSTEAVAPDVTPTPLPQEEIDAEHDANPLVDDNKDPV